MLWENYKDGLLGLGEAAIIMALKGNGVLFLSHGTVHR